MIAKLFFTHSGGFMKYQEPEMKLIYFQSEDVVTASGEHSDWNPDDDNIVDGWGN